MLTAFVRKPLDRMKSIYILSLHETRGLKFIETNEVTVKTYKIVFSRTEQPMVLKLSMQHLVLKYYQIPSNDGPRLTFDLFTQMSISVPYAFV